MTMSKDIIDIIERIKTVEKIHTDTQVAATLGISRANLSNYRKKGSIPYEALSNYCERQNLSLNYILFGKRKAMYTSPAFRPSRLAPREDSEGLPEGTAWPARQPSLLSRPEAAHAPTDKAEVGDLLHDLCSRIMNSGDRDTIEALLFHLKGMAIACESADHFRKCRARLREQEAQIEELKRNLSELLSRKG